MAEEAYSTLSKTTQIAKFMGPTWGPPGSCRPQMSPILAPQTLLSGHCTIVKGHTPTDKYTMPVNHISVSCNAIIFYAQYFLWTNVECSISMLCERYLSCRTWCRAIDQIVSWANLLPLPTDLLVKQPLGSKRGHFIHLLDIWCFQVLF